MSILEPDTNGSQFFIVTQGGYSPIPSTQFGLITEGMDLIMRTAPATKPPLGVYPVAFNVLSVAVE
jgi:cyclophilin family peptidyl-prolyl cis-trans isomerase